MKYQVYLSKVIQNNSAKNALTTMNSIKLNLEINSNLVQYIYNFL